MPAYTFHIVPLVIHACGLKPVFIDVLPGSHNMNPDLIETQITSRTRAILPTHMYGHPCEMKQILDIAATHGLKVLEDCAHALGAVYGYQKVGSLGDLGTFTFAMAKNMPCFGGGMITTNDQRVHQKLMDIIRPPSSSRMKGLWKEIAATSLNYGATLPWAFSLAVYPLMRAMAGSGSRAFDSEAGQETVSAVDVQNTYPSRITNLQAAVGDYQLRRIDAINAKLNDNARIYNSLLKNVKGVTVPSVSSGRSHTYLYYRIRVSQRNALRQALLRRGVDTMPDDMSYCPDLAPFRHLAYQLVEAEALPRELLELPNNLHLKEQDIRYIAESVRKGPL